MRKFAALTFLFVLVGTCLVACQPTSPQNNENRTAPTVETTTVNIDDENGFEYDEGMLNISATRSEEAIRDSNSPLQNEEENLPASLSPADISSLSAAQSHSQIIIVSTTSHSATSGRFALYSKQDDGSWIEEINATCFVGEDGIGSGSEKVGKTPVGIYHIISAFGNAPDPGCSAFNYKLATDDLWWVCDATSPFYNKMVSDLEVDDFDKDLSEHISECGAAYDYVLEIGYNTECVPGAGSAIFVHCSENQPTEGCVAIDENEMRNLMMKIHSDCVIIIDVDRDIQNY